MMYTPAIWDDQLWIGIRIGSDESADAALSPPLSPPLSLLSLLLLSLLLLSLDEAALSPPLDPAASSLSDPQADATIAKAARMTMNRFNMKRFPLCWLGGQYSTPLVCPRAPAYGPPLMRPSIRLVTTAT